MPVSKKIAQLFVGRQIKQTAVSIFILKPGRLYFNVEPIQAEYILFFDHNNCINIVTTKR